MTDEPDDLRSAVGRELLREHCRATASPGFFRLRLAAGAPWVAACVTEGREGWRTAIDGAVHDWHPDPALAKGLLEICLHGEPITEAEYRYLLARAEWCRANDPGAPEATPKERFDPLTSRPIF
jgi:hypothetical protein